MLRKPTHVYVMKFQGNNDLILAKIGISCDPKRREDDLNGITMSFKKKPRRYSLYAIFRVDDEAIARSLETEVCKKFKLWTGRELLDTHPERVYSFCKKRIRELGFDKKIVWKVKDEI